jgi:hypothetical protein
MVRVRIVLAALLAVSALAVLAVPASGSAPAANKAKFCKAIKNIPDDLKDSTGNALSLGKKTLQTYASGLRAAGKQAPANVKKAANNLASFYSGLASGDASALSKAGNLGTSFGTFFTYVGTNCN